jgi:hypothetical protein
MDPIQKFRVSITDFHSTYTELLFENKKRRLLLVPSTYIIKWTQIYRIRSVDCGPTIDISWLDWAYKSSTCDVMYRRQHAIYITVVKFRNTIWPPPPQLSSNSNEIRSYIAERTQNAVYIVRCLWVQHSREPAVGFFWDHVSWWKINDDFLTRF